MPETAVATTSLLEETRRLLKESGKPLPNIYKDTDINFFWLKKFKAGDITDPSVNTVQKLYEYLTGKPLIG